MQLSICITLAHLERSSVFENAEHPHSQILATLSDKFKNVKSEEQFFFLLPILEIIKLLSSLF